MSNRIAVLIDAENTSVKYADVAIKEIIQYGDLTVQRMYGDFSQSSMAEWSKKGLEYAIVPIHQTHYTKSKNAADIMLVIDAMDILFRDLADIFCLISSDSDFTRLVSRLREGGKTVIGMGKSDASKSFITACNEYKFLDKISEEENVDVSTKDSAVTPIADIMKTINDMIQQQESVGERLNLGPAKSHLKKEYPDFDERNYGYSAFKKFVEEELKLVVIVEGSIAYVQNVTKNKKADITQKVNGYILQRAKASTELGLLGNELHKKYPTFKYKELGYSKLSKYVESIDNVTISTKNNKQHVVLKNKK